jgi:hypothetical protein
MKKLISVRHALEDPAWLGTMMGADSFRAMRILLIAAMGEEFVASEMEIFTQLTGRAVELWILAGRRAGKSIGIAVLASYLAACVDYRDVLAKGERGTLPILAASTTQAAQIFNFCKGIFTQIPRFANLVQSLGGRHSGVTSDTIALRNQIDIAIRPASFRTIRGLTSIAAIAEECSIWQSDESRNPDKEILAAVRPSLATTGGTLFAIGSPHARRGETWATYRKHFGPSGNPAILVANGPTKVFNPTIKQSVIDRAYEDDPQVAASEWGGQFRSDLESYVSPETVDACTVRGVEVRPYDKQWRYVAHADPSGGSQDSFCLAIGHVENDVGILDLLVERRPPFSPAIVVEELAATLGYYHLAEVTGDKFAAGFTVEAFSKWGITYRYADKTTSDYFASFLPILHSRRCSLLDNKRLASQLCSLERRSSRVGAKEQSGTGDYQRDIATKKSAAECELRSLASKRRDAHPGESEAVAFAKVLMEPGNVALRRAALAVA